MSKSSPDGDASPSGGTSPSGDKSPLVIYRFLYRRFGPQRWWPAKTNIEVVIGAILTQNTAWTNVEKAIRNLRNKKMLNAAALTAASKSLIATTIRPAGYYNVKADRLKYFMDHLRYCHAGRLARMFRQRITELRKELLSIKGVGPETADSILLYAARKASFVVDAYTRRIFSRLEHIRGDESYDQIQQYFMDRLETNEKLFNEYHALIVKLAKTYCRVKPACTGCPLEKICPAARPLKEGQAQI